MKNNLKKRIGEKKLVWLLARGYLGFTVVLLVIFILVFSVSNAYYSWLFRSPDVDGLMASKAFEQGRYEDVNARNFLGSSGGFAVIAQDGSTVYRTENFFTEGFTQGELSCIQSYDDYSYVEKSTVTSPAGEEEHLLIKYDYTDDVEIEERTAIVSADLKVKNGSLGDGKTSYTEKEFAYLTGDEPAGFDMMRCGFVAEDDSIGTLVFITESRAYDDYQEYSHRADRVYLALIPLYFGALVLFLMWLNKKIKDPLVKLNNAVDDIAAGGFGRIGEMEGPLEIRQIGSNMDRMADKLEESEKERKRLDAERQKLLADISHDLKTPITVISGYTKAIRDGRVPPEKMNSYLQLIDSKAEELTGMINSFHEYSKSEHPEFALQPEETDICEFMRSYMADRYEEIEIAGFAPVVRIPESRILCMVDNRQMRRALDNIVYNAIRHNSLGTMLVVSVSEDEGRVKIVFGDNGSGIPEAYRQKIFEPFIMGDESRHGDGSGLGLAITRNIIKAHGGTITLCDAANSSLSTEFEIILKKI